MSKLCISCMEVKPLTEYCNRKASLDGKQSYCKKCNNEVKNNTYHRERKYWQMIDDIIDKPVGKGCTLLEAVGDGNIYTSKEIDN
jgi:hypothetical protein